MSETPRTDRMVASWPLESFGEMTGLARQLERENAALREQLANAGAEIRKLDLWATEAQAWAIQCEELLEGAQRHIAERDAEIAALKGHAEAMAGEIRTAFWGGNPSTALARYRAAYPKE